MPRYAYIAKREPKETIRGDIEAESEQDAINRLAKMGCFPVSIQSEDLSLHKEGILHFRKTSNKDIVLLFRHLSVLIDSGVNVLNSLNIIAKQTPNRYLRVILSDIIARIKDGRSLSQSLISHPDLFPNLYTSMINAGEIGGTLNSTLKRLSDFLEREEEFRNSLRSALMYPAFVFSVGVITVIILLTFVIPRLVTMFEDMGQVLPLPTRILINTSGFLRHYWWLLLAVILMVVFFYKRIVNKPQGKMQLDKLKLKIAVLGQVTLKTEISRLMRTLSLLLSSGIPVVYALDISASILENQVLKLERPDSQRHKPIQLPERFQAVS